MSDIHPHIATCNCMAQFHPGNNWLPVNISSSGRALTPAGLAILVKEPFLVIPMTPVEIHEKMKADGDTYIENFHAKN